VIGKRALPFFLAGVLLGTAAASLHAEPVRNGFDLADTHVDVADIVGGGPARDGIPALAAPDHVAASAAPWADDVPVLGVTRGGEARAYPIPLLDWHELVNDGVGGEPILVSWCPLCGTGMVFDRRIDGQPRRFAVSGLLYRSDVLMYDRETESLWSQIASEAISGPLQGQRLVLLRSQLTTWGDWKRRFPATTILSRKTGHLRDYDRTPYGDYATSRRLLFPVAADDRFHPKELTVGLRVGDEARAYTASELSQAGGLVEETFAGARIRIRYEDRLQRFDVEAPDGVEVIEGYWFAWALFHPRTTIFESGAASSARTEPRAPNTPIAKKEHRP
jgi:hypothetical protein